MIPDTAQRRALVAEDDTLTATAMSGWLKDLGWAVITVDSAEAALAAAIILRPQLAVCDVALRTERDGTWLAAELLDHVPETRIVYTTANPELPGRVTLKRNVAAYLQKPFERNAFARAIQGIDVTPGVSVGSSLDVEWPTEASKVIAENRRALVAAITDALHSGPFDDVTTSAVLVAGESIKRARRGADLALGVSRLLRLPSSLHRYLRQAVLLEPVGRQIFPEVVEGLPPHERSRLVARDAPSVTCAALLLLGRPEAAELLSLAAGKGHLNASSVSRLPISELVVDVLRAVCLWRRVNDPIDPQGSQEIAPGSDAGWGTPDSDISVPVRQAVERVWRELCGAGGDRSIA